MPLHELPVVQSLVLRRDPHALTKILTAQAILHPLVLDQFQTALPQRRVETESPQSGLVHRTLEVSEAVGASCSLSLRFCPRLASETTEANS